MSNLPDKFAKFIDEDCLKPREPALPTSEESEALYKPGDKVEKWVVRDYPLFVISKSTGYRRLKVPVRCQCGTATTVCAWQLRTGRSRQCTECANKSRGKPRPITINRKKMLERHEQQRINNDG